MSLKSSSVGEDKHNNNLEGRLLAEAARTYRYVRYKLRDLSYVLKLPMIDCIIRGSISSH